MKSPKYTLKSRNKRNGKNKHSENKVLLNVYNAKNLTPAILKLQKLVNDSTGKFDWHPHFSSKEVKFIYDVVSGANNFSDFSHTELQSRWAVALLKRLELILKDLKKLQKKTPK